VGPLVIVDLAPGIEAALHVGQVYLFSTHGQSTATGGFAITGGTGGTDGADGVIHVDGINRSADYLP
jgi:hypothetical protein